MPCRDDWADAEYAKEQVKREKQKQERLDKVTRLLCEVLTEVEDGEDHFTIKSLTAEQKEWWENHKATDKKRVAAEEKAKQEEKKRLLDRAEKLKNELKQITKKLDEVK